MRMGQMLTIWRRRIRTMIWLEDTNKKFRSSLEVEKIHVDSFFFASATHKK
jgi:hypothetical protein